MKLTKQVLALRAYKAMTDPEYAKKQGDMIVELVKNTIKKQKLKLKS